MAQEDTKEADSEQSLSELRIRFGENELDAGQVAALVLEDANALAAAMVAHADVGSEQEALLVHAWGAELQTIGKDTQAAWRDRMFELAAAAGGKVNLGDDWGSFQASVVKDSVVKEFTDRTRALLEDRGVLAKGCNMSASLKRGVTLDQIPTDDLRVLEKYFEIDLHLDEARVNSLVELGLVSAEDLEATLETRTVRAGSPRLTVRPSEALVAKLNGR